MPSAAEQFVTPQGRYDERAAQVSGVRGGAQGMAPYPLYGVDAIEGTVAWYKRPIVVLPVGVGIGIGLGWLWWAWLKPKMKPKKNPAKKGD